MSGNSPISKQLHKKKTGEWSETCYGWWTRRMTDISNGRSSSNKSSRNSNWNTTSVCTGINLVRVRDLDVTSIETTHTHGLQVIISETTEQREPTDSSAVNSSDDIFSSAVRLYKNSDGVSEWVKGGAENLKNGAYDFTEMLRKWRTSDDAQVLKRVAYNEFQQFRKWLESFWK